MEKEKGTIARVMDKGFGFIAREGEEKDVFFHANSLVDIDFDDLKEGDEVLFNITQTPKGDNAVDVERA